GRLQSRRRQLPGHMGRSEGRYPGGLSHRLMFPSNIRCPPPRLERAAAHLDPGGRLAFELMNPHWLRATRHPEVRVLAFSETEAAIEVDYHPPGGRRYTQVAQVTLVWPEQVEAFLYTAGLRLERLTPSVEGDLAESPSFYVEARRAGP